VYENVLKGVAQSLGLQPIKNYGPSLDRFFDEVPLVCICCNGVARKHGCDDRKCTVECLAHLTYSNCGCLAHCRRGHRGSVIDVHRQTLAGNSSISTPAFGTWTPRWQPHPPSSWHLHSASHRLRRHPWLHLLRKTQQLKAVLRHSSSSWMDSRQQQSCYHQQSLGSGQLLQRRQQSGPRFDAAVVKRLAAKQLAAEQQSRHQADDSLWAAVTCLWNRAGGT
jgi:hypothetical protein